MHANTNFVCHSRRWAETHRRGQPLRSEGTCAKNAAKTTTPSGSFDALAPISGRVWATLFPVPHSLTRLPRAGFQAYRCMGLSSPVRGVWTFCSLKRSQSRRDCITQPRVARRALPWEPRRRESQPCKGCITPPIERCETDERRNPFRVECIWSSASQGSARRATLGSVISSLQDGSPRQMSKAQSRLQMGAPAVRCVSFTRLAPCSHLDGALVWAKCLSLGYYLHGTWPADSSC
jgi:hypothetical protein